ncbi:MAG: DUF5106 domain-containing protein [Saprospiraceae bacterium]|nr:DUF5106 domain-containing protein [Saprospiraceae bacterium]
MRYIHLWLLPGLFCICGTVYGQQSDAFRVDFHLNGFRSPVALVGRYSAGNSYVVDSVAVDTNSGTFYFRKNNLQPGVFFVAANGKRLFDFILPAASDSFSISGTLADLTTINAANSVENEAYFAFERQRQAVEAKIIARQSMYDMVSQATNNDPKVMAPIEKEIDTYYRSIDSMARAFIVRYPGHLYAKMLQSVRPPSPPKSITPTLKGKSNPVYPRWMRRHYWDNTDFRDERLLNNQFWPTFFDNYFDRFVVALPDSITAAVDQVLEKMPKNGAFYRFAVLRFVQNFEMSDAPGADQIFVHMVDNYMKPGQTPWQDIATLSRLEYKSSILKPVLTGKVAPALELSDEKNRTIRLDTISAPLTLLVFYSPLCSHCMDVMPGIYQTWLDARVFGLKAVAVSTDNQYRNWQQFIRQQNWEWYDLADPTGNNAFEKQYPTNNLPVLYLLDKNKRILRKRIKPEELRDVLKIYLNSKK